MAFLILSSFSPLSLQLSYKICALNLLSGCLVSGHVFGRALRASAQNAQPLFYNLISSRRALSAREANKLIVRVKCGGCNG